MFYQLTKDKRVTVAQIDTNAIQRILDAFEINGYEAREISEAEAQFLIAALEFNEVHDLDTSLAYAEEEI